MADASICQLETTLRKRVSRFLADRSVLRSPVLDAIGRIREEGWPAVIFGGAIRDLMVHGFSRHPRDIDIVVDGVSTRQMAFVFGERVARRNRFGGLQLWIENKWLVDIWPLKETWAFRQFSIFDHNFSELPKTTFLGSAQEFVKDRILGCFPQGDEFSLGRCHALGLQ